MKRSFSLVCAALLIASAGCSATNGGSGTPAADSGSPLLDAGASNPGADGATNARDGGGGELGPDAGERFPELGFASKAAARIEGAWSNAAQATSDAVYSNVRLQICRVPLKNFGAAIFYQQTTDGFARRRLLSLAPNDTGFALTSYAIAADDLYADWCTKKSLLITENDLRAPSKCIITYVYSSADDEFHGTAPAGTGCESTFQGSVKLEVDEWFAKDQIRIWERWYDAAGKQVAGAPKGPYLYIRQ
jgi:CpeT/CpcT family (DUF1001)